jgi:hypothetical protein
MTKTIFKNKKNGGMIKSKDLDCCGSNMHIWRVTLHMHIQPETPCWYQWCKTLYWALNSMTSQSQPDKEQIISNKRQSLNFPIIKSIMCWLCYRNIIIYIINIYKEKNWVHLHLYP